MSATSTFHAVADGPRQETLLARAAATGDRAALREVLHLVGAAVLGGVRSVVGPAHPDLDDLVQESLIGVVQALASFRGDASLVHFARRIAVRRAIDGLRTAIRARRRHADLSQAPEPAVPAPSLLERRQGKWRALLAELPAAQAEALVLRAVEGCSVEEIATITGAPAETVRSRLRLAKNALRARIAADRSFADSDRGGAR